MRSPENAPRFPLPTKLPPSHKKVVVACMGKPGKPTWMCPALSTLRFADPLRDGTLPMMHRAVVAVVAGGVERWYPCLDPTPRTRPRMIEEFDQRRQCRFRLKAKIRKDFAFKIEIRKSRDSSKRGGSKTCTLSAGFTMTFIFCTNRRTERIIFEPILKRKTTSSSGGLEIPESGGRRAVLERLRPLGRVEADLEAGSRRKVPISHHCRLACRLARDCSSTRPTGALGPPRTPPGVGPFSLLPGYLCSLFGCVCRRATIGLAMYCC
jgi:hypothetical protein